MKISVKFSQFIWNYQKAYNNKRISFIIEDFVGLQSLLEELYEQHYIAGYKKNIMKLDNDNQSIHHRPWLEVILKYNPMTGQPLFFFYKNVSKPGRDVIIRLPELKAEAHNEPFSLGIINTAKYGMITTRTALQNKTGGIYLGKIK